MNRSIQLNPPLRPVALALASLTLMNGAALAQTGALNLNAYRSMAAALDSAVTDRASGSAASLNDLDRAAAVYAGLKTGISSPLLTGGIDRALQSSRAALSHTPADLEAQVVQARSLMRKALYDQTLGQVGAASSTPQATLLAGEFGLQGVARSSYLSTTAAHDSGAAARLLRRAAAQQVQRNLTGTSVPLNSAQRTATYLALARATGWFTVAQDAPDTGGLKLAQFTQAITQLTGNDTAGLTGSLSTLNRGAAAFVAASERAVKTGRAVPPAQPSTSQPTPVNTIPATPTAQPSTSRTTGTQTSGSQSSAATSLSSASGLSAAERQKAGLNPVYASLARAQAAAGHADLTVARTELGAAARSLTISGLSNAAGYDALASDLEALQGRSGVRSGDVQALIAEANNLERRANTQATSLLDTTSASVSRLPAPIWPLLFLIVGLLSLYPMYLLNLAFGGRNSYWRAIAAGLGLLFLPVLLDGLGGTFAFLGDLSGVSFLRSLGNLSLHQGVWGLPVWLLLTAGAVALTSYGFRGLCRQFGLLGGSGGSADPALTETPQPALDWDEEL
ncbi:hypothetical protein [Deinococcus sp.]|uniref:hypothetical protein n=1 Tax=Deinococcus sp. TaxID=47478 RepID=UPI003C7B14D0